MAAAAALLALAFASGAAGAAPRALAVEPASGVAGVGAGLPSPGAVPPEAKEGWYSSQEGVREAFSSDNLLYSDSTGPDGTCVPAPIPKIPGNDNPTIDEWCAWATRTSVWDWEEPFNTAFPLSDTVPRGDLYGCVVSNSWQAGEARFLPGFMGKTFRGDGRFSNIVWRGPLLPPDRNAYPGRYYVQTDSYRRGEKSWILDYASQIPGIGPVLDRIPIGQYLRNFGEYRDEMREVSPGMWVGRVYALPLTLRNPSPFNIYGLVPFVLFQSCPSED